MAGRGGAELQFGKQKQVRYFAKADTMEIALRGSWQRVGAAANDRPYHVNTIAVERSNQRITGDKLVSSPQNVNNLRQLQRH